MKHETFLSKKYDIIHHKNSPLRRRTSGEFYPMVISEASKHVAFISRPQIKRVESGQREVLDNLCKVGIGNFQEHRGSKLIEDIKNNSSIERIVFMGSPGVGKSTIIEQFVDGLFDSFESINGSIQIKLISFDPVFRKMLEHSPRKFWDKYNWKFVNDSLYATLKSGRRSAIKSRRIYPSRRIEIIEVPFVGTEDRGRSFVDACWNDAKNSDKEKSMVFVPIVQASNKSQQSQDTRRVTMRENIVNEVSNVRVIDEKISILAKYGILLSSELLTKSRKKVSLVIKAIIDQIKSSANPTLKSIVNQDFRIEMKQYVPPFLTQYLSENIQLPYMRGNIDKTAVKREIFFWERILDEMGVPSENRYIMLNKPFHTIHRRPEIFSIASCASTICLYK